VHSSSRRSSGSLFQSPSLPSLNSPSESPSNTRTSRYSSITSTPTPSTADSFSPHYQGWWAPDPHSGPSRHTRPQPYRTYSQPVVDITDQEQHNTGKRRRSDGPPALRDAEESTRIRWQAQSRNASYPIANAGSISGPSGGEYQGGFRTLYPPTAMIARGTVSGQGHSPVMEMGTSRSAPILSRNVSIVGGQLSQTFADLRANEREGSREDVGSNNPISGHSDRRSSLFPGLHAGGQDPVPHVIPSSSPRRGAVHSTASPALSRQYSMTRPPTPERLTTSRPMIRRSSVTNDAILQTGGYVNEGQHSRAGIPQSNKDFRPSFGVDRGDESGRVHGWGSRRASGDSHGGSKVTAKPHDDREPCRKRSVGDVDMIPDPDLRGLSTKRSPSLERKDDLPNTTAQGPKYMCDYCAKTFTRPSSLRIHVYSRKSPSPSPLFQQVWGECADERDRYGRKTICMSRTEL
jgi:hypothetical protein